MNTAHRIALQLESEGRRLMHEGSSLEQVAQRLYIVADQIGGNIDIAALAKALHPLGLCIADRNAMAAVVDLAELAMTTEMDLRDDHSEASARQSINHCTAALHGH